MGFENSRWRVRLPDGSGREYSFDDLMAAIGRGEVTRETFVNAPAKPDEYKAAGDWPLFWVKFRTRPWRARIGDSELVVHGDAELVRLVSAGRIKPNSDIFDPVEEEWVKAQSLSFLNQNFRSGCLTIFVAFLR